MGETQWLSEMGHTRYNQVPMIEGIYTKEPPHSLPELNSRVVLLVEHRSILALIIVTIG